ncbi:uncharacterized protein LOC113462214 isoform X1 [Phoenix dactylifera]|uniref:Uncharacterized protein LOC113462214 isoform X1 n=1 Tax=Phoenix dactylifera TaxID=42345 RepID=A0A8B9AWN2_PHODC|nr:uncharacterized protein LOC113462214 isoform X1 [Phoenix dactylifera]
MKFGLQTDFLVESRVRDLGGFPSPLVSSACGLSSPAPPCRPFLPPLRLPISSPLLHLRPLLSSTSTSGLSSPPPPASPSPLRLHHASRSRLHHLVDAPLLLARRLEFSEPTTGLPGDIKFGQDGRHILSRDYMTLKLWDINMDSGPVATFQVHEYLRPQLCDLYESDSIFDKFECCLSGDGLRVANWFLQTFSWMHWQQHQSSMKSASKSITSEDIELSTRRSEF